MSEATDLTEQQQGSVAEISSPSQLIQQAVQSGATVETLEKLMDLQERHEANEAKKAFHEAMQQFQQIKPELKKTQKVSYSTKSGGKTEYNFCPLSEIEKSLKEPLGQCHLSYRFENTVDHENNRFGVRCIVSHVQGHSESTEMEAPMDDSGGKNQIQQIGSTTTYLQRYTLISAFGLVTADEDDDGQSSGDDSYIKLIFHNEAVRNNLQAILDIKESLHEGDYSNVCEILDNMPEETLRTLWVAPTKGGIFSTEERGILKSNDFHQARNQYYQEKQNEQSR